MGEKLYTRNWFLLILYPWIELIWLSISKTWYICSIRNVGVIFIVFLFFFDLCESLLRCVFIHLFFFFFFNYKYFMCIFIHFFFKYSQILLNLFIYKGILYSQNPQHISHISPTRAKYGVSFVCFKSGPFATFSFFMFFVIYTEPHHKETQHKELYIIFNLVYFKPLYDFIFNKNWVNIMWTVWSHKL